MRRALAHRGPDGQGEHIEAGVGLGHTRLSIIDLAGGAQPLANEDESIWLTFNGEIYNYRPLMERLQAAGHRFRTRSDSEVLVHLYEELGPEFVRELNGMFAFALHDRRRGQVLLGRDHYGIKPLFYTVADGALVFASEIKAVLAGCGRAAAASPAAVQEYLLFRCCTGDRTFFDGVHRLPPGHTALWREGRLTVQQYWEPPIPAPGGPCTLDQAAEELEARLDQAVRAQLMSEVPLGTFCSGGVDSGLTTLYAARGTAQPLHTFSVGFRDAAWDETPLAQDTARRVGSIHHVFMADPDAYRQALPRLIWHHDEPLGHPNSVLIALLSRYARQRVTVVLTGEGSDEIFGGYPRHHIVRLTARLAGWPAPLRQGLAGSLRRFGGRRARLLGGHLDRPLTEAIVLNSAFLPLHQVADLTGSAPERAMAARLAEAEALMVQGDPVASISRYDQRHYLPALLDRMDRMTMATGLEGRVPFLDVELAEWAARLPPGLRLGWRSNKRVVKHLAARYLSPAIVRGPKSGFGVPIGDWLKTPGWSEEVARLRDPSHPAASLVDTRRVQDRLQRHIQGEQGHADALWLLLNLYHWSEIRFDD